MDLSYSIKNEDGVDKVFLDGAITQDAHEALSPLIKEAGKECTVNMKKISYINSLGLRAWHLFIHEFQNGRKITYEEIAADIVRQFIAIPNILQEGNIVSFYAEFHCPHCEHEQQHLFQCQDGYQKIFEASENLRCDSCQQLTECEDDEAFFDFLDMGSQAS